MSEVLFVTGNDVKFHTAQTVGRQFGVEVIQHDLKMLEMQADNGEEVASYKAEQAYSELGQPLVVSDDSWTIPGLQGFPGPYMRYINEWFRPQDWLNLTAPLENREIYLQQVVVYQAENEQRVFATHIAGTLLREIRGESKFPHFTITSFDNGEHSAAEVTGSGSSSVSHLHNAWHDLFAWLKEKV